MKNTLLRVPVVCPECGRELLNEFPIASIAEALSAGGSIRLHVNCHDKAWQASVLEREQVGEYLDAAVAIEPRALSSGGPVNTPIGDLRSLAHRAATGIALRG
jgi:hypothetical protein